MPKKPKRPCSYPGCPALTDGRYCEPHQKEINRQYEKYERDPDTRKRYGRTWKRIRDRYIAAHPLCEQCLIEGRFVSADHVHHIIPVKESNDNRDENLLSLCVAHHSAIHLQTRSKNYGQ